LFKLHNMNNDLVKLYKEISGKESGADVKDKIESKLHDKMRECFLELISIGGVSGYDQLHEEMVQAVNLIQKLQTNK